MEEIGRGAEAIIYKDKGTAIKIRPNKGYRITEIDTALRRSRTRREARILEKIPIAAPRLISCDGKERVEMEFIDGQKVRDILDARPELAEEIGKKLAAMHDKDIIHGDLTTSNMILDKKGEIRFIDFGLSLFSRRIEDKAVDIHLFRQALESKHHRVQEKAYMLFLKGYNGAKDSSLILKRLQEVEARGRYKGK